MTQTLGRSVDGAILSVLMGVEADYLQASIAAIRAQYGSVEIYLERAAGLDVASKKALEHRAVNLIHTLLL